MALSSGSPVLLRDGLARPVPHPALRRRGQVYDINQNVALVHMVIWRAAAGRQRSGAWWPVKRPLAARKRHSAASAVDLRFPPNLRRVRAGTSNPKTALES